MSGDVWGLAKSGCVGHYFGPGFLDLPVKGGPTAALWIMDDTMTLEIDNGTHALVPRNSQNVVNGA